MTKKIYDVVAVTGEYTNQQGETKKRYVNVGVILDSGDGPYLILEKWFNPAGIESKFLSLFKPKDKNTTQQTATPVQQAAAPPVKQASDIIEDSIPW